MINFHFSTLPDRLNGGNLWINLRPEGFPLQTGAFHRFSTLKCGQKWPVTTAKWAVFSHIHSRYYYYWF
jgi:hypothetical protein